MSVQRRMVKYKGNRLPNDYQEVEWIQSSGTQYIDIGVSANQNTKVDFNFSLSAYASGLNRLSGFVGDTYHFNIYVQDETYNHCFGYRYNTHGGVISTTIAQLDTIYNLSNNKNALTIKQNDTVITTISSGTTTSFQGVDNIYIFASNLKGTPSRSKYRLYYYKLYDNEILIRDFVPCYNKLDGIIGLYDLCGSICPLTNSPFYISSGTGTFTKGEDINGAVKQD